MDLNALEMKWSVLFDETHCDEYGREMDPLGRSAIWVDPSKPWLSLRIALHNVITARDLGEPWHICRSQSTHILAIDSSRICIYQLDLTGHEPDTTWTAKRLAILRAPGPCMKQQLRLDKECVLEQCSYGSGKSRVHKLHVFRYSDAESRLCVWNYSAPARVSALTTSE